MFEDLTTQTKELLTLNGSIQNASQETARYNQELEFLRREFTEKDRIIGNMQDEIEARERRLEQLKSEFNSRQKELEELQGALREALGEGKELDSMIDERDLIIAQLEAELKGNSVRMNSNPDPTFKPSEGDDVDTLLHEYLKYANCDVPI